MRFARPGGLAAGLATAAVLGAVPAGCVDRERAGIEIPTPWPRPAFVLNGTDGTRIDFAAMTQGHPTLLLFGYTSCPDVCPAHMAVIAGARRALPPADRERLRVVFITADPDRDTPAVLGRWLRSFDSTFIGLTGTAEELDRAAAAALVPSPSRHIDSTGHVVVAHYERVLGMTGDDSVRVLIPSGVGVESWTRELRRLVRRHRRRRDHVRRIYGCAS